MALRIIPAPTFKAKVSFSVAGEADVAVIDWEFRHKSPEALKAWWEAYRERPTNDAIAAISVGWLNGVIDEAGNDVPYSEEALVQFLAAHGPRREELLRTYTRELTESRQKN